MNHRTHNRRRRRMSFALASFLAMTSLLAIGVANAAATWSLQTVPKLAGTHQMNDVSCVAGGECIAVGDTATGTLATRAMRWNGTEWAFQTTAAEVTSPSTLQSVSCTSASFCMAVGYASGPLAESWDGKAWKKQVTGLKGGELKGVSCASSTECIAVGVGNSITRWNGTEWKSLSLPEKIEAPVDLKDVSCPTASFCMAVGKAGPSGTTFTMTWNGTKWTQRAGLSGYFLEGVSCTAENACTTVGYTMVGLLAIPAAGRWNGAEWKTQSISAPAGSKAALLNSVSCSTATVCVSTGFNQPSATVVETLAERWNGTAWEIQSTPNPAGATTSGLAGVSCISATICESVGLYKNEKGETLTLAERSS